MVSSTTTASRFPPASASLRRTAASPRCAIPADTPATRSRCRGASSSRAPGISSRIIPNASTTTSSSPACVLPATSHTSSPPTPSSPASRASASPSRSARPSTFALPATTIRSSDTPNRLSRFPSSCDCTHILSDSRYSHLTTPGSHFARLIIRSDTRPFTTNTRAPISRASPSRFGHSSFSVTTTRSGRSRHSASPIHSGASKGR